MYAHYAGNHIVRIYTATVGYLNCILCVCLSDYFYLTTRMKNTMLRAYKRTYAINDKTKDKHPLRNDVF